ENKPRALGRADERMPLPDPLGAQERAMSEIVAERPQLAAEDVARRPREGVDVDRFVLRVVGDGVERGREASDAAGERPGGERTASVAVRGEVVDDVADR